MRLTGRFVVTVGIEDFAIGAARFYAMRLTARFAVTAGFEDCFYAN